MKYALIVGSESGLAKSVINRLNDYTVFCCDIAYLKNEVIDNKHFIYMDVTNVSSIQEAYKYISNIQNIINIFR